ncbi:MAG: putative 2-aminoethylphosphonate ABC transporter permease subunit [Burkholderiales bacterium]|nr:putative 2-aminoethylphosphonate ABC transporter permease subunit [Burkholderiales bacterium]
MATLQPAVAAATGAFRSRRLVNERAVGRLLLVAVGAVSLTLIGAPLLLVLIKSTQDPQGQFIGIHNFVQYASNPGLRQSVFNSLLVCAITVGITVPLAFLYAMALMRSRMPFKPLFKGIALLPLLAPSMLPAIALTYVFGNQGFLKSWLMGGSIYGLTGIVMAQVFYCFPHAFIILTTALSLSDARMYEVARTLGTSPWRAFHTITLPAARYGLLSAVFVVITLSITDFGIAKVIGGKFSVLAIDIYKQIIGQQNFQMGAVVGVVLLIPAVISFAVDMIVRRRQISLLGARTVIYRPEPRAGFDSAMLVVSASVAFVILGIAGTAIFASFVKLWPYDMSLSLRSYNFAAFDALGWGSYWNSIVMSAWTAIGGTAMVFLGAYLVEKVRVDAALRSGFHLLAMLPLAVPGLVLGLGYVFFFNNPANPLTGLMGTLTLMAMCCIAHYYTVPHVTALTALKQIDSEFEAASATLGVAFWTTLRRVTLPICLPAILDIATYFFVSGMTTVAAVIFLYAPLTEVAAIAIVAMDDTGDTAAACAMAVSVLFTSAAVVGLQALVARVLARKSQVWRQAGRG